MTEKQALYAALEAIARASTLLEAQAIAETVLGLLPEQSIATERQLKPGEYRF